MHSDDYRLKKIEDRLNEIRQKALPDSVPDNLLDFISEFRPKIGKKPLNFDKDPFWIEPLLDEHPHITFVNGRQTYKTTNASSLIAWVALAKPGSEVTYVADDDNHRSAFSEQRLRQETFIANDKITVFFINKKI